MKELPDAFPLPSGALAIMKRIGEAGGLCVVVGGAVRDVLRGREPEDVDLASSLPPERVVSLFPDCRLILDGEKHGTVGILWDGEIFEVTSFRRDGDYPDRRHPAEVTFTGSLEEDLRRRDFTVNAMAWSRETGLVDPFGGKKDLEEGLLRAVGDPEKRFGEDSLRILRLLRFLSTLGFRAEEETGRAARRLAPTLENVSGERIARELEKLLAGADAPRVLREYRKIASLILGEYHLPRAFTGNFAADLALLFRGREEAFEAAADRLRLSRRTREEAGMILGEMREPFAENGGAPGARALLSRVGEETALRVSAARRAAGEPDGEEELRKAIASGIPYRLRDLAVRGDALREATGLEGRELGKLLEELLRLVMEEKIENDPEALLRAAGERKKTE